MLHEVNKICRTCLDKSENLFSIYDGDENRVVEMLEYILDTSLGSTTTTDELPQNVCHQCLIDIGRCYTFKMKCNNSYELLKNMLDKRKEQPEVVVQIKVEPGAATDESQIPMQELSEVQPALEIAEIRIKEEPTDWQRKQLPNQMRLRRKGIVPTTSNSTTNNLEVSEHQEHYTVQYSIVEVNEAQDPTEQLPPTIDEDINIRHCASCGAGFAEEKELVKHLEDCQAIKPRKPSKSEQYSNSKKHKCPYCEKSFPRPCRLKNHLRVHSGNEEAQKSYNEIGNKCQQCNKSFALLSSLKDHLSTHKGENPLQCSYCGQVFKKKFNLNRHLRYHTDAKKHQCKKCDRTFLWVSNLKRHMLYHNSCNSYVCELCSKQYAHKYLLQQHILTHNDGKPFKCKFCGNGFTREYNRNIHQRRHMENSLKPKSY